MVASGALEEWRTAYATIQNFEAWSSHLEWITRVKPSFAEAIRERYEAGSRVTDAGVKAARAVRERGGRSSPPFSLAPVRSSACQVRPMSRRAVARAVPLRFARRCKASPALPRYAHCRR
jgi:hypothetical protein